ncbi:MAG: SRPBCC family protein [Pseudomonadota bacterium]
MRQGGREPGRRSGRQVAGLLLCMFAFLLGLTPAASAAEPVAPWMLAEWQNPAPRLADTGLKAGELALAIGRRLVILPHAPRDVALPGSRGLRTFRQARFVSAVAVVDLPAATVRRRLADFSSYRSLFPLLPESQVMALDGPQAVARYRLEIPLPATATFSVDFRVKQTLEADGSISALLIDGTAESLIAMLGGMTDNLADQPVAARWEFLPLNPGQSLVVFTYWDRIELKSFFARKFIEAYPELKLAGHYLAALMAAEAIHRNFIRSVPRVASRAPQGMESLASLRGVIERFSRHGHVAILEPDLVPAPGATPLPLRYVTLATRVGVAPAAAQDWATRYHRLPEAIKELKDVGVRDRGRDVDLDLGIHFGVLLIRFSMDLQVRNTWAAPHRLEFARTAGDLAQVRGATEWHALPGEPGTLMLVSAAHEVGEDAPLLLRMAHKLSDRVPYIDQLGSLVAQLVIMERMKPWIEKNAAAPRPQPAKEIPNE